MDMLRKVSHRPYHTGFYLGVNGEQNYDDALNKIKELQNDASITLTDEENTYLNTHESLL